MNGEYSSENFIQEVPNSHWFSSLEQILNYAQNRQDKYLEIGIKNSIDKGFLMVPLIDLNEIYNEL